MSFTGGPADACLIDLDGTVFVGAQAVPGAAEAIAALDRAGVPYRFTTNTTRKPRAALVSQLAGYGIRSRPEALYTAPLAAARWLAEQGIKRAMLLLAEATIAELDGLQHDAQRPQAVVVGDLGRSWTFARLNSAFQALHAGARLVAIQKNRCWDDGTGLQLDAGAFVAALEYAAGQEAVLVGKPAPAFFATAAAALAVPRQRIAVIGDNVANDVVGAQAAGCLGVAVTTGTFRPEHLRDGAVRPDAVLDSLADLPHWLGL